VDIRVQPLRDRREALEAVIAAVPAPTRLRLSPLLPLATWDQLETLRAEAAQAGAEGVMLKAANSLYQAGRRRGSWWKHKREPLRLDAVLLYAQAGSGQRHRRAPSVVGGRPDSLCSDLVRHCIIPITESQRFDPDCCPDAPAGASQ
jgi:ATP-dependent DNA ligase